MSRVSYDFYWINKMYNYVLKISVGCLRIIVRQQSSKMEEKGNPNSIKLPDTLEIFRNLKNAKQFAIDIGEFLLILFYYMTRNLDQSTLFYFNLFGS